VNGSAEYEAGHIPGSGYLDLQRDFSIEDSRYSFTLPSAQLVAEAFERHGVGDGMKVVLYSRTTQPWATRFWWMLRWLGFDAVAILDGGYQKWIADGRDVSKEPADYRCGQISINERPNIFVCKDEVLAAIGSSTVCTINALGPDIHSGKNSRYGRLGRIPGSTNVPAANLVDPTTMELRSPEEIASAFTAAGADPNKRNITYCGGGIFATLDAYLLHQLGYADAAVYDNSMSEWATTENLPVEVD
ncbi:MAG: sulfurtransferase, partial [Hyphomicrobiales bacterium]|nr:sulfurtransferase [Hyphomicrobiales bacterium]